MIFIHNSIDAIKISDISLKTYKINQLMAKRRPKGPFMNKISNETLLISTYKIPSEEGLREF
jgi:hypothetical protein